MADNTAAVIQLNALAKDLAATSGVQFQAVAAGLVQSATIQVASYARQYAPRRTGRLANSIVTSMGAKGLTGTVTADTPYAKYDEFGTGTRGEFPGHPIVIVPRRAKYLRFRTKDGRTVYTKRVVSQGMAPRPFLRPAVERIALPLATAVGNNAVIFIVRGSQTPETLTDAPTSAPGRTVAAIHSANTLRQMTR